MMSACEFFTQMRFIKKLTHSHDCSQAHMSVDMEAYTKSCLVSLYLLDFVLCVKYSLKCTLLPKQ